MLANKLKAIVRTACLAAGLLLAGEALAQQVQSTTFDNGLRLSVISDHRSPVVVHMVWYKAGSMDEPENVTGIAHMLEHMMFKGSDTIPAGEFSKIVSRLGGMDNAFTSRDYTAYFQKISRQNLPKVVQMEADRMANLTLAEKDFLPERDVVSEERRMRVESNPIGRFYEQLLLKHYDGHPYAHPVIGYADHIKNYSLQNALDWYGRYYSPSNAELIFVGDITLDEAKQIAAPYAVLNGKKIEHPTVKGRPLWTAPQRFSHRDPDVQAPMLYRLYRIPSLFSTLAGESLTLRQSYALSLLAEVLGGGRTSRLYADLVLAQKLADAVSVDVSPASREEATFDLFIQPRPGVDIEKAEQAADATIAKLLAEGVTEAELAAAKVRFKSRQVYAQDDLMTMAKGLGAWLSVGGSPETFSSWVKEIDSVTVDEVMAMAKKWLNITQSTTGLLLPQVGTGG